MNWYCSCSRSGFTVCSGGRLAVRQIVFGTLLEGLANGRGEDGLRFFPVLYRRQPRR